MWKSLFTPPSLSFLRLHEDKLVSLWSRGTVRARAALACRLNVRNTAVCHRIPGNGARRGGRSSPGYSRVRAAARSV